MITNFTQEEIENNHLQYVSRLSFYKEQGFDQIRARQNIIKQLNKDCLTVLEIGTGKGYLTKEIAKKYKTVVSIDLDPVDQRIAALNAAYENVSDRIEFIIDNGEKLKFPDNFFDVVISAFTFHHLVKPFTVIDEMMRLTGKQLIISDFNEKGFAIINKSHDLEGRKHDKGSNDFNIVGMYLENYGFKVKKVADLEQIIFIAERW